MKVLWDDYGQKAIVTDENHQTKASSPCYY